jgi:hypothetical protein
MIIEKPNLEAVRERVSTTSTVYNRASSLRLTLGSWSHCQEDVHRGKASSLLKPVELDVLLRWSFRYVIPVARSITPCKYRNGYMLFSVTQRCLPINVIIK